MSLFYGFPVTGASSTRSSCIGKLNFHRHRGSLVTCHGDATRADDSTAPSTCQQRRPVSYRAYRRASGSSNILIILVPWSPGPAARHGTARLQPRAAPAPHFNLPDHTPSPYTTPSRLTLRLPPARPRPPGSSCSSSWAMVTARVAADISRCSLLDNRRQGRGGEGRGGARR